MSTIISSPEVLSSVTTSYAWTGTANSSASVELIDGVETRRNLIPNPSFTTGVSGWSGSSTTTLTAESGTAKAVSKGGGRNFLSTPVSVMSGATYTASANVLLPAATATAYRFLVEFYVDLTSYTYVGESAGTQTFQAASDSMRASVTFTVPANATGIVVYPLISTGTAPVNETVYVDLVQLENTTSATSFFQGSSPSSTTVTTARTTPILTDGYQSNRTSRTVVHEVLGRSYPDITQFPMSLRSGTLTLVYSNEADAVEAERMHVGGYVMTYADSDLPSAAMTYIVNGSLTRELDPETRSVWLVTVDYQEVTQ